VKILNVAIGFGLVFAVLLLGQVFRPPNIGGFIPGRVLITDAQGYIVTASGSLSDCITLGATSSACSGGSSITFVEQETPSGAVNGSNAAFVLAFGPVTGSVHLYKNGIRQTAAVDYTIAGSAITFLAGAIPQTGDTVRVDYRR
jgi:hypothetical protein